MTFSFKRHTTATSELLVATATRFLVAEEVDVESEADELSFQNGTVFLRMSFEPFQLISSGRISWSIMEGGLDLHYRVDASPVWLFLPVFMLIGMVSHWTAGCALAIFLILVKFIQQRAWFMSLVSALGTYQTRVEQ
ncbi:MAG: hypothetical protein KDB96_18250 [Flavobacteriales bacterium]|nr:hypothetical protein [Flavobacteriales bacterium]